MFEFVPEQINAACIKVVGVGGAGGNAINRMIDAGLSGVEFLSVNTDSQALEQSHASHRLQVGEKVTGGLGSGGLPEVGRRAVEESREMIVDVLDGANMVFVTAGMGGGTGTGAAPVIAEVAREVGALTVGVVTKPFEFEGQRRMRQAEEGLAELKSHVDTLIVIPNQRLLTVVGPSVSLLEAFATADEVLLRATRGISELITMPALVNLDFADVRTIMANMGDALMGTGAASGENRAIEATQEAISSPLLEDVTIQGAKGVLISISGGNDLTLQEVNEATSLVCETAGREANIIFGAKISDDLAGEVRVTVIATGVGSHEAKGSGEKVRRVIPREARVERNEEQVEVQDLQRPAFRRREGMLSRWKTQRKSIRQTRNEDDLDTPTFLRAQAD